MRVAYISLFRRGRGGGEGRVANELASRFAERHEVVMICPAVETGLRHDEDGALKVFGVRSAGEGEFHMPVLSAKAVRAVFDFLDEFNPHVVHAHEPALLGLIGQVWAKMHLVPFVHTSHILPASVLDFGAVDALDMRVLQGSFGESISRRLLTDFYENCDAIIALNQPALAALREFGYDGRVFVIPNGRDLERYAQCGDTDVTTAQKTLTFVGYMSERKNQHYLLEVHRLLPEPYRLLLIGKALKPEYGKLLRSYCEAYGLDNVVFVGQVPHEEIPGYLEKTHVFVSASKMEVQSLVVIEALASGTPLIGLANETTSELVDDQVGCCLPRDAAPEEFAVCVERVCALPPEEYQQLCKNARERVSHLDWSNVVDQTVAAYRELINERPPVRTKRGAVLDDLISFLPSGEVKEIFRERVRVSRSRPGPIAELTGELSLGQKWRALKRVEGSTWLLAGGTVLVSLVSYLFMRRRAGDDE